MTKQHQGRESEFNEAVACEFTSQTLGDSVDCNNCELSDGSHFPTWGFNIIVWEKMGFFCQRYNGLWILIQIKSLRENVSCGILSHFQKCPTLPCELDVKEDCLKSGGTLISASIIPHTVSNRLKRHRKWPGVDLRYGWYNIVIFKRTVTTPYTLSRSWYSN